MYNRFSQLSFVIGLFFFIVAVILAATAITDGNAITRYTAIVFAIFGIVMMFLKSGEADAG